MPHSFSYAVSMNLEHSIKEGSHERYPDHFQCFRNIKKIKYPDFQAMTLTLGLVGGNKLTGSSSLDLTVFSKLDFLHPKVYSTT